MAVSSENQGQAMNDWVLDVSMTDVANDVRAFCPTDGIFVMDGMTMVTDAPPGELIGLYHPDGNEALEAWQAANGEYVRKVFTEVRGEF